MRLCNRNMFCSVPFLIFTPSSFLILYNIFLSPTFLPRTPSSFFKHFHTRSPLTSFSHHCSFLVNSLFFSDIVPWLFFLHATIGRKLVSFIYLKMKTNFHPISQKKKKLLHSEMTYFLVCLLIDLYSINEKKKHYTCFSFSIKKYLV